jgi:hypothetical protein
VLNLKFLPREEVQKIFNLLCIFHPYGMKIMSEIEHGEPRRLLNQICRATSQILND